MAATLGPWRIAKIQAQRVLTPSRIRPVIGDHPWGGPESSDRTVIITCSVGFNIAVPNAANTYRLGLAHGFAAAGVRYRLASVLDMERVLAESQRPFVFLALYDYLYL